MENNEVKVYAVRITQRNSLAKVMRSKVTKLLKKYRLVALSPDGQSYEEKVRFLATLLLHTEKEARSLADELEELGIETAEVGKVGYVDKKYADF